MDSNDIRQAIEALFLSELQANEKAMAYMEELKQLDAKGASPADKDYAEKRKFIDSFSFKERVASLSESAKMLRLGTHISKGINPASKGDGVIFKSKGNLPATIIGSHLIKRPALDITGSNRLYASDTGIYSFLNLKLPDGSLLVELLVDADSRLKGALSEDEVQAKELFDQFRQAVPKTNAGAKVDVFNKQIYFPLTADADPLQEKVAYRSVLLVPLFPSSLNLEVFNRLKVVRAQAKKAGELRTQGKQGDTYYVLKNLGLMVLGGTRSVNTSKLTQKTAGCNFLFSNLHPRLSSKPDLYISMKCRDIFDSFIFMRAASLGVLDAISALTSTDGDIELRKIHLEAALIRIASSVLDTALSLQKRPVGYLSEHNLPAAQKLWLDPYSEQALSYRQSLQGEVFDWSEQIVDAITAFMIEQISVQVKRSKTKKLPMPLNSAIYDEWREIVSNLIVKYRQMGREVFKCS